MDTEGLFAPDTADQAREYYAAAGPSAQTVIKETTRAMGFDSEEYDRRVDSAVVETARDALFASLLEVHVGSREEFEEWQADTDYDIEETGSEHVDNVVWHGPPATETAVAATFQDEPTAAVETLRRQAYGRLYRPLLAESEDEQ